MIKIKNKTIIKNYKFLDVNSISQGFGLMFTLKKNFNYALIFDRGYESIIGSSIHMFFVFFPINVIFLNSKKEVVDLKKKLLPFTMYFPKKKARYIIELPQNIDISFIKLKDKVLWQG